MGERIRALADPNPVDQLACLVLRVLAELSPCTERSFLEHVLGAEAASHSHTRQLAHSALLKLKALAFIEFSQEHVAITDEGRGCLRALPVVIPRQVPTADREQEGFKNGTKAKLTKLCVSSLPQLQVWLRTRHDALLRVLATTSQTKYGPWLKWFCQISSRRVPPGDAAGLPDFSSGMGCLALRVEAKCRSRRDNFGSCGDATRQSFQAQVASSTTIRGT